MASELRFSLLGDGPSDACLLRHLRWLVEEHIPSNVVLQFQWADLGYVVPKPRGLRERIRCALDLYPCSLLFVHRDAEREHAQRRYEEIREAVDGLATRPPVWVGVVPIRMTESWLLIDEQAIRSAAGNPRGNQVLPLPRLNSIEDVANPKEVLHEGLRSASGLTGRRLAKFRLQPAVRRVAEYLDSFETCRQLSAFARLEDDVQSALRELRLA